MNRQRMQFGCAWVLAVLSVSIAGCPEKPKTSRVIDVAGTIEQVDLANGALTVSTYLERTKTEESFVVKVRPETEILINGALARVEDIRVGERAQGSIMIERQGEGKKAKYIADQIRIERAEAIVAPESESTADTEEDAGN